MPSMISLDGQFKADIYNQNEELISSGDWGDNFITSTGLSYPLTMPYANAFMYLSLGSGKQPNDLYTTGLWSGLKPHIYSPNGAHPLKLNFLWTTGIVPDGCGFVSHLSGVELFRAWRIPEEPSLFLEEDLHVSELMTSPATTGGLGEIGTSYPDTTIGGKFYDPYSGYTAFNRIQKDFTIPSGDYAIVTYKLNFVLDKEVHTFDPFIGLNNAKGAGKTTWQKLTGAARIMHPGIQLIPPPSEGDEGGSEEEEEGEAVTGPGAAEMQPYGQPLEPSCSGNIYAYFSTDNTQYRFDPFWGGAARTGLQRLTDDNGIHHWTNPIDNTYLQPQMRPRNGVNLATGFSEYYWNLADVLVPPEDGGGGGGGNLEPKPTGLKHWTEGKERLARFVNFRRKDSILPIKSNFTTEFTAGKMGQAGYNDSVIVTSLNHDMSIVYTGQMDHHRHRNMTRVLGWQTINAIGDPGQPGTYISYKSLVFCADKAGHRESISVLTKDQFAFFDSQFGTYDSQNHPGGGEYLATITSTGEFPYESNDDKPKFSQPSDAYPYHDNQNGLSVTWQLTWSAPCGEVAGACSKYDAHDGVYITKAACETAGGIWTECTDL